MRVPVVFVLRVLLCLALVAGSITAGSAFSPEPALCLARIPTTRETDALAVRWPSPLPGSVVYRVDTLDGYWTYPASPATSVSLRLPATAHDPMNLSIVRAPDAKGISQPCPVGEHPVPQAAVPLDTPSSVTLEPDTPVADPLSCGRIFTLPAVVNAIAPRTPPGFAANGRVVVQISLDGASNLTGAAIAASNSPLLNEPALTAARGATFRTSQFRCVGVPGSFNYIVEFIGRTATPNPTHS